MNFPHYTDQLFVLSIQKEVIGLGVNEKEWFFTFVILGHRARNRQTDRHTERQTDTNTH